MFTTDETRNMLVILGQNLWVLFIVGQDVGFPQPASHPKGKVFIKERVEVGQARFVPQLFESIWTRYP